jgi:hypothetical protein
MELSPIVVKPKLLLKLFGKTYKVGTLEIELPTKTVKREDGTLEFAISTDTMIEQLTEQLRRLDCKCDCQCGKA